MSLDHRYRSHLECILIKEDSYVYRWTRSHRLWCCNRLDRLPNSATESKYSRTLRLLYPPGSDWWGSSHRLVQERCAVRPVRHWSRHRLFCLPCCWPGAVRETRGATLADRADPPDSSTWSPLNSESSRCRTRGATPADRADPSNSYT